MIENIFKALDIDLSGSLTEAGIGRLISQVYGIESRQLDVRKLMANADVNRDGEGQIYHKRIDSQHLGLKRNQFGLL